MTDADFLKWLKTSSARRVALVEVVARIAGVETTLYLSNRPYVTGGGDTPANTAYLPCINGGVELGEELSLEGQASISWGDIEIDNRNGVLDTWLGYVWANRGVQVFIGDVQWPRADFRQVFDGVVGDIGSRSLHALNLQLLDKLQRLNAPLSETQLGGSTANKDRLLPLTFGECFNVTPLLIDPATLKYRVHDGAIEDIIEVRDNGVPVSFTKQLAAGTFTLNQSPAGVITCSVQGDKPGIYANDIATLVQRVATGYGPAATRFTSGDLDAAQLAAFAAAHPDPVGLYAPDRLNVLLACQQLASSVGARVVCTTQGKLRLVQLALPPSGTPTAIGSEDIVYQGLAIQSRPPVRAACRLGYCRNYTVQTSGLAGGLQPSSVDYFGQEWRVTTSSDAAVASIYRLDAQPEQEDTLQLSSAYAMAEAQRRRALWSTPRTVYTLTGKAHLMLLELGDPVTLTFDRFGLNAGATGQVVSVRRNWLATPATITLGVLV